MMSGQLNSDLTGLMSLTFISTHLLQFILVSLFGSRHRCQ